MPSANHVESYYAASANAFSVQPALQESVNADVCVVGGGFTGLSAALNLAERGFSVVLLEAERIGWGASGRNGGHIGTEYNPGIDRIEQWVGRANAQLLWDLSEEAKDIIRQRVTKHAIDCDLRWGYLHAAEKRRHLADMDETLGTWRRYGYRAELKVVRGAEVRAYCNSPAYVGGLVDGGAGWLHPLNYCLGLAAAARAAGVKLFEGTRVTRIEEGSKVTLHTDNGAAVTAPFVVMACNAYLGDLIPKLRRRIMPVGTYIGATRPLPKALAEDCLPTNATVADHNFVLNYFQRSGDDRMLFGGGVSYTTLMPPNLPGVMRRKMVKVFPQLRDETFEYVWGGYVGITVERTPHLGRTGQQKNIYFAQGYSGQGVALTGIAGKVIAEAIAGQAERFDAFGKLPHSLFPGGKWLRAPVLALAMTWYRLRDLLP